MKIAQFEKVIGNENIDEFMEFFGFEFPEQDVSVEYLETEWYNTDLPEVNTRKKENGFIVDTMNEFSMLKWDIKSSYRQWLNKYAMLYKLWTQKRHNITEEKRLVKTLSKPFENYAYKTVWLGDDLVREYGHKTAAKIHSLRQDIAQNTSEIEQLQQVSDEPPNDTESVVKAWENYNYAVLAKEQHGIIMESLTEYKQLGLIPKRKKSLKNVGLG